MITRDEILMGRDKEFPLSDILESNLSQLLVCLNRFRELYGRPMLVSSGYRPGAYNTSLSNSAKKSNHLVCLACDFKDVDGNLAKYCLDNINVLERCGVYLENPTSTVGWVHLQIVPPKSNSRVFNP